MSRTFYFRQGNDVSGPVTTQQLREMVANGTLSKTDYVRAADQEKWYLAGGVKGLFLERQEELPRGRAEAATLATEHVIDVEGFERDRKRRRAARRKITVPLAIAGGLIVIIVVVIVRNTTAAYVVLRDEVTSDTPIRGQIEIDLLIDAPIPKDNILEILRTKFNEAIRRKVFSRREHANCVVVSAFSSIEHYRAETTRRRLAEMTQVPADDKPQIDFNDVLHNQLFEPPETKHGLSQPTRQEIYEDYLHADWRAWRQAEKEYPIEPDLVLKAGDSFHLVEPLMLMGQNNAEEWFAKGCPSMEVPAGTEIKVIQTVKNDQGTKYTEVAAYPANEQTGYKGWVLTYLLGLQHPVLKEKDRYRKRLELQDARAQELKKAYARGVLDAYSISQELLESIYTEGSQKQWPY